MQVLLLGKAGMLGNCFLKRLAGENDFELFAYDQNTLDIKDKKAVRDIFSKVRPHVVINCAAYTNVDGCESDPETAFAVNGDALEEIAKQCEIHNSILIHFSTDYVFDGEKKDGYSENDETSPINTYGKSKLAGEIFIQENMKKYYIIRTSWLYGENGKNFVDTMIELSEKQKEIDVVDDQIGCPTYAGDLAEAIVEFFIEPHLKNLDDNHEHWLPEKALSKAIEAKSLTYGIYHLTNAGFCSWNEFASEIFKILGKDVKVNKVTSDKFPRPAKRPAYSILINTKTPPLRKWQEGLRHYLDFRV